MNPLSIVKGILGSVEKPLTELIPDRDLRAKLEKEIATAVLSNEALQAQLAMQLVNIESTSDNWLSKNYRPLIGLWAMGLATLGLFGLIPGMSGDLLERLITGAFSLAGLFTAARSVDKFARAQVLKSQLR